MMADDAPANAGTEDNSGRGSALPDEREGTDPTPATGNKDSDVDAEGSKARQDAAAAQSDDAATLSDPPTPPGKPAVSVPTPVASDTSPVASVQAAPAGAKSIQARVPVAEPTPPLLSEPSAAASSGAAATVSSGSSAATGSGTSGSATPSGLAGSDGSGSLTVDTTVESVVGSVIEPPVASDADSADRLTADPAVDSVDPTGEAQTGRTEGETVAVTPTNSDSGKSTNKSKVRRKSSFWRELPVLIIIAVALAVLIRTFLVQAFFIPSGSMEKTLHGCPGCSGDRVLVNKIVYHFRDPRPGDVVVFRGPPSWESEVQIEEPGNPVSKALRWVGQTIGVAQPNEKDFVKRVIAVGGQTVRCCDSNGKITVDGQPLDEPYVFLTKPDGAPQPFGPVTVPKGRLWVMGDHRDGSADSRAHIMDGHSGTIPVDNVIGKAFVIVWPPSRWDTLGTPGTFHNLSSASLEVGAPLATGLVATTIPVLSARRRRRRGHTGRVRRFPFSRASRNDQSA